MFVCYRRPTAHLRTVARTQTHTHTHTAEVLCAHLGLPTITPPVLQGWTRSFNLGKLGVPDALHRLHCVGAPRKFCGCIHASPRARGDTLCAAIPRLCRLAASEPGLLRPAYRCTRQLIARISGCAGHLGIADTSRGRMGRRRRRPSAPSRCVAEDGVIPSTSSTAPTAHIAHQRPKATSSSHALTAYGTPGPLTAQR